MNSCSTITSVFVFLTIIGIVSAQTCTWAAWGEWSTCSDTCGNCGSQTRTRTCPVTTGTSCICSGDASQQQNCGPAICLWPRASCCIGAPASVNGMFECA